MNLNIIFTRLWNDYIAQNPSAGDIYRLFLKEGENVVNDHIAFRTLDYPEINIDVLAQPFISNGYVPKGEWKNPVSQNLSESQKSNFPLSYT